MTRPFGFDYYTGKRFHGWLKTGFSPPAAILDSPEEIGGLDGAEHLLDCAGRQIYRVTLGAADGAHRCFTYQFTNHSWGRSLRRCYAFRSLHTSLRLGRSGFHTLEVLAALKRRGDVLNWTSLLIAREIEGVSELPSTGQHVFQVHSCLELTEELGKRLGEHLASFHGAGFFHGDLKTRHILVSTTAPGEYLFYFVDLEKCVHFPKFPGHFGVFLAARDLIQLFASLQVNPAIDTRAVILRAYLSTCGYKKSQQSKLRRILELYGTNGRFRQGRTLLGNLLHLAVGK